MSRSRWWVMWVLVALSASGQTIYTWTDASGDHFTDDPSTIPKGAKARTTTGVEPMLTNSTAAPVLEDRSRGDERAPEPTAKQGPARVTLAKLATEVSEVDQKYIEDAIETASSSERLSTWGGLTESVGVEIHSREHMQAHDGSDAFGLAEGKNRIKLRAPKDTYSWGRPLPYAKTMLHELGHILENQHAAERRPRWFSEGFANLVADFGGYASLEDVAWWTIRHGGETPLDVAFTKMQTLPLAYAVATEGVRFLVELVHEDGLKAMFALRKAGASFDDAFSKVAGFSTAEFQRRFVEHVRPSYHERAE